MRPLVGTRLEPNSRGSFDVLSCFTVLRAGSLGLARTRLPPFFAPNSVAPFNTPNGKDHHLVARKLRMRATRSVPSSAQGLPRGHDDEASGMHRWKSCFCLRKSRYTFVAWMRQGARAAPRTSLRLRKDNLSDPVEARKRLAARRDQSALTYETLLQAGHRRRRPSSSSYLIPC